MENEKIKIPERRLKMNGIEMFLLASASGIVSACGNYIYHQLNNSDNKLDTFGYVMLVSGIFGMIACKLYDNSYKENLKVENILRSKLNDLQRRYENQSLEFEISKLNQR